MRAHIPASLHLMISRKSNNSCNDCWYILIHVYICILCFLFPNWIVSFHLICQYPSSFSLPTNTLISSSSSPLSHSFRVASLNVGLGFEKKLPHLLMRCAELHLDIVAVQEIGDPALLSHKMSSYQLSYAPGPSKHQGGVGLLISIL